MFLLNLFLVQKHIGLKIDLKKIHLIVTLFYWLKIIMVERKLIGQYMSLLKVAIIIKIEWI